MSMPELNNNVVDFKATPVTPEINTSEVMPTKLTGNISANTLIGGATVFAAGAATCELVHRFVIPAGKWAVKKIKGIANKAGKKGQEEFVDSEVVYEEEVDNKKNGNK